ncbi:MAG TPA: hypothetical protein VE861_14875, partial [Gemmatimonadaceae bacterium]|nr:hypothetical protein [Gemmatimonadaceae bacterium]
MSLLARTLILTSTLTAGAALVGSHHPATAAAATPHASVDVQKPVNKYGEVCASCHQADGKGLEGAIPPLAGSEW